MIISNNRNPSLIEFSDLVDKTTRKLNDDSKKRMSYYLGRNWSQLEDNVKEILDIVSVGTPFEGTIIKVSGQRFPDIVISKYYGIEVKSSKDESWITLGGSVKESTRVEDVERIFITFGKLTNPVEFRSRPYEDCLYDVVMTHSPRYRIDMNLEQGNSIFDKMNISYNDLRNAENPVNEIINYYRESLNEGEGLWWIKSTTSLKVKFMSSLSSNEKKQIRIKGLSLFPCIFSNSPSKYDRFTMWLMENYNIISPSMRDLFSSGGKGSIVGKNQVFSDIPKVIMNVNNNNTDIIDTINNTTKDVLIETWNERKIYNDRLGQWIDLVSSMCILENCNTKRVLNTIFNR
jgi:hypothetical protein